MGLIFVPVFLVILFTLPTICYFAAHLMPNMKALFAYILFWLTGIAFLIYDLSVVSSLSQGDDDLSLGWVMVTGYFYLCATAGLIGIIGKIVVLNANHKKRKINIKTVHNTSILILFMTPFLLQLLMFAFAIVDTLVRLVRIFILNLI